MNTVARVARDTEFSFFCIEAGKCNYVSALLMLSALLIAGRFFFALGDHISGAEGARRLLLCLHQLRGARCAVQQQPASSGYPRICQKTVVPQFIAVYEAHWEPVFVTTFRDLRLH